VAGALALHVLLFALMFAGMWWTRTANPVSAAGAEIEADLVDPDALSAAIRHALDTPAQPAAVEPEPATPPPQPTPEPRPEDAPVVPQPQAQDVIPEPDVREQERVEREAEAARRAEREQEEKRRQEQIDLTERKRQEAAEQKQRLAKQQELADKLAKVKAERAKAAKQADLAEQKLKQIADARSRNAAEAAAQSDAAATANPPPGNDGNDNDLLARYQAAIQAAIRSKWTQPDSVQPGQRCQIVIHQLPGGEVVDAKVAPSCPYDEFERRSVEAAVLKAQPLPYAGFESVFNRTLRLNFFAEER
jgi:colicin import membrane protein